jgi:hypothetical protein
MLSSPSGRGNVGKASRLSPNGVASIDHHDGNFAYGGAAAPAGLITGESLEVLAGE